jgi:hypothetical protein
MARLTLKQKQKIFDRKSEPISKLIKEFGVSATVICQHQKVRASRKIPDRNRNNNKNENSKSDLSLFPNPVSLTISDIVLSGKITHQKLTIETEIKPLTGLNYDQLRQYIELILEPFRSTQSIV